jgi:hypothetical protein
MIGSTFLTGRVLDQYLDALEEAQEGDVWMRPQLDSVGRLAVAGRHANWGYSGFLVIALHADGARRKFLRAQKIFPLDENGYAAQNERHGAECEVLTRIAALKGEEVIKVKGGWRLANEAKAIARMSGELAAASENKEVLARPLGLQAAARYAADPEARRKFEEILARTTKRSNGYPPSAR